MDMTRFMGTMAERDEAWAAVRGNPSRTKEALGTSGQVYCSACKGDDGEGEEEDDDMVEASEELDGELLASRLELFRAGSLSVEDGAGEEDMAAAPDGLEGISFGSWLDVLSAGPPSISDEVGEEEGRRVIQFLDISSARISRRIVTSDSSSPAFIIFSASTPGKNTSISWA